MPERMALPVKACGVLWIVKVMETVLLSNANSAVCAVSAVSMNADTLPVHDLMVATLIAQLPDAPKGVASFVAPLSESVHLEASEKACAASVTLAPIPANAANFLFLC